MFPGPGAEIIRNEVGEVLGWDYPPDEDSFWCDACGFAHIGDCPDLEDDGEEEDGEM